MKKVSTRTTENYERPKKSYNRRCKKLHPTTKKASTVERKPWTTNEKLQPAVTKATTGIEKSFKLIVLAMNPRMTMTSFCCNHSWFCYNRRWNLLQPFSQLLAAAPPSSHACPWPSSPRCRSGRKKVQRLQLRAWWVVAQMWAGPTRAGRALVARMPSRSGRGQPDRLIPMAAAPLGALRPAKLGYGSGKRERQATGRRETGGRRRTWAGPSSYVSLGESLARLRVAATGRAFAYE